LGRVVWSNRQTGQAATFNKLDFLVLISSVIYKRVGPFRRQMGRWGDRRADEERRRQGDREIADCKLKT